MQKPELSLVLPTFNESSIIDASLRRISQAIGALKSQTEVLIADDGSDDLPQKVESNKASYGFLDVRVLRNPVRAGKGASIANAFKIAHADIVGFADADLSVDPTLIPRAVSLIQAGNDMAIGSRKSNRFESEGSWLRSVVAYTFEFIHRRLLFKSGRKFDDTQCGFKFFRREIVADLYRDLVATDGLTDLEVLVRADRRGFKIAEIEVPRAEERESKRPLSSIFGKEAVSLGKLILKYGF